MSTDLEPELRELFRDKAGDAPAATPDVAGAPRRVLRRARFRQLGTVAGSAAIAFAIVVGSVAGLNALLGDGEDPPVGGGRDVFERTAAIEAFTITSPSDWYLVDQWPRSVRLAVGSASASETCTVDPEGNETCSGSSEVSAASDEVTFGLPIFRLSNWDLGLSANPCGAGLGPGTALLYVAFDAEAAAGLPPGVDDPSFDPWPGSVSTGTGPCGAGTYAWFTVNGQPFFAWAGFGEGVSATDRTVVTDALETMTVDDGWVFGEPGETTPAYVIAGGEYGPADPWRIDLRPADVALELTVEDDRGGAVLVADGNAPLVWTRTDPIAGVVEERATGVEFQPGTENDDLALGQPAVAGTIVDVPPTLDAFGLDLFFIDLPAGSGELGGRVVITGGSEPSPSVNASPAGEPRTEVVELSGTDLGYGWVARFAGRFADGSACIRVTIGDERFDPHCPQVRSSFATDRPSLSGWLTPRLHLLAGTVPLEVESIDFVSDTFEAPLISATCEMGPRGWTDPDRKVCVMALAPEGSGSVRYLDVEGNALFVESMAWDAEATSLAPGSKQYPWTNENGFITATGSLEGTGWTLEVLHYLEGYRLTAGGEVVDRRPLQIGEALVNSFGRDDPEPPITILLVLTGTEVRNVSVIHESGQMWFGRWIPGSTENGDEARVWIVELPGSGEGTLLLDDVGGSIVRWPSRLL